MALDTISIVRVDYANPRQAADLKSLLHEYAEWETGMANRIADDYFDGLPESLARFPTAFSLLAYRDDLAVGLINGFFGFSTFAKKRLINIHDVTVTQSARGQGVATRMLEEVERIARENNCCRITLEVLEDNEPARRAYQKSGFARTPHHPQTETLFLQKTLA
jgi:GNAT superfamily N-acetyltransferase